MAHMDEDMPEGFQLALYVSREDFKDAVECAMDEAVETGKLRPLQRFIARRRMRNERVLERAYRQAMADAPQAAFWTEDGKFDWEKLLNWLLENLPKIIAMFAMI